MLVGILIYYKMQGKKIIHFIQRGICWSGVAIVPILEDSNFYEKVKFYIVTLSGNKSGFYSRGNVQYRLKVVILYYCSIQTVLYFDFSLNNNIKI